MAKRAYTRRKTTEPKTAMKKPAKDAGRDKDVLAMASNIVSGFVQGNKLEAEELQDVIVNVYGTLSKLDSGEIDSMGREAPPPPAVPIKDSYTKDYIICLEDGKKFKTLKRHLSTEYDMTPAEYKERWGLPHDYPMVAPAYAKARSNMAKKIGLGRKAAGRPRKKK